ncbi:MAG: discoidin domain-containing protein, partial [Lachnospiraceae bacterium]|nr:discoidin domain-containing protein [Lachnospiraceae bacterium]
EHIYLYEHILKKANESYQIKEYTPTIETTVNNTTVNNTTVNNTTVNNTTVNETTTEPKSTIDPSLSPKEVFGQVIVRQEGRTVSFNWGADDFIHQYGQTFNVYYDGVLTLKNVNVDEKTHTFSTDGTHTIRITGVLNGKETAGQTLTVVIGDATTQQPTTQQPTTQQPTTQQSTTQPQTEVVTHKYVQPGVQREPADSGVVYNTRLTNYFEKIDTVLSSTLGNQSGGEGIDKLFDNNVNTKFFTGDAPAITLAWKMKRAVVLKNYTFVLAGDASTYSHRDPHSWSVYGSIDGENWTTLSNIEDGGITHVNRGEYTFSCTTQTPCQYFMIIIKNSGSDGKLYYGSQMSEIYLNGDVCQVSESIGKDVTGEVKGVNTSATTVVGFNSNESVDKLFDSNNSTKLFTTTASPCSIAWTMNNDTTLYSYTLTTANDNAQYHDRTIKSWQLYGSTDGNNWTLIDTVSDSGMMDVNYGDYTYMVDKVGTYRHYKLTVNERYGNSFQLAGISLKGSSVVDSEYKALFVGDWDKVTAPGYQQALHDAFYEVYPRQYKRWGTGTEPKKIFVTADKSYDGVAYTAGSSIVIAVDWMNNNPTGIGYFTHELTHAAQQYGNVSSSGPAWWVENMANYGGFRYYHWASAATAQVYFANDKSLQNWNYEAYGNNKWFFTYMDSRYPTRRDANGNVTYGLIDSLNHLLKDNKGTRYDDNPYDTTTPWNQTVKRITGYDCIESLRLHYVDELNNGTWNFTGFKNFEDNWITENLPGVPNINYPEYKGKIHGNTTHNRLSSAVTSGNNLMSGATVIGASGQTKASEAASMFVDGNLSTKWCATTGNVDNAEYSLEGAQHFVKIDLGSTKTFNTYTLYNTTSKEGYGNTTEWEVLISNDGKNWTSLDYQIGKNDSVSSYDVGTQNARYIVFKVFNADNGGSGTARLYELQLYNR